MVWVRNEPGNNTKNGKRVDLHVRRALLDLLLIHRYICIVFFVYVKVLQDALTQEVLEVFESKREILYMRLSEFNLSFLADN